MVEWYAGTYTIDLNILRLVTTVSEKDLHTYLDILSGADV